MSYPTQIVPANDVSIRQAGAMLRDGKLVAFPTETVYGLGADATNNQAVAAIFAAKGRPQFNPLIVHVAQIAALDTLIKWNETALLLSSQFWPGPLTLVLPRKDTCPVSLLVSAGMETLAVRIPAHPVALQLLRETGRPIAAPSANASGKLSPTAPIHVVESLGHHVGLILAGGKCRIGLESTVVDVTTQKPTILRHGGITIEQLEKLLGPMAQRTDGPDDQEHRSPGLLISHYAPNLPLRLNATAAEPNEALLTFGPDVLIKGGGKRLNLSPQRDLNEAAANLFSMLRQLDEPRFTTIAVTSIPSTGLGAAINDRLKRASFR